MGISLLSVEIKLPCCSQELNSSIVTLDRLIITCYRIVLYLPGIDDFQVRGAPHLLILWFTSPDARDLSNKASGRSSFFRRVFGQEVVQASFINAYRLKVLD